MTLARLPTTWDMRRHAAKRLRRAAAGVSWRQGATVVCGLLVVIAMVVVSQSAQTDAKRHVDVDMAEVQAAAEQIAAITWQGQAEILAARHPTPDPGLVQRGYSIYAAL